MDIKIKKNPYGDKELCDKSKISIDEGITVLVGANGVGKSSLLKEIRAFLAEKRIPCYWYNQDDSKSEYVSRYNADMSKLNEFITSSEGEQINICINDMIANIGQFIVTGNTNRENFLFEEYDEKHTSKERWILLDGVDSGLSIDSIEKIKKILETVANTPNVHIVMSANHYETTDGLKCFDVKKGEYITFTSYENYKAFIRGDA